MSSAGKNKNSLKIRIDQQLVNLGLVADLKESNSIIMAGRVLVDNHKIDKPGTLVKISSEIKIKGRESKWVSRGGLKLAGAIRHFSINVKDKICVDLGASTGGFTDVLLHNGAAKIYAVDVGYGQLAWKLQSDERVVVLDKTNARTLNEKIIPDKIEVIVCDASFISLKTILPAAMKLAAKEAIIIALIKPQFEAEKDEVEPGGMITNPEIHKRICADIKLWLESESWKVEGVTESPIKGMEGNTEFLIFANKT